MNTDNANREYVRDLLRAKPDVAQMLYSLEVELCYVERNLQLLAQIR